MEIGNEMAFARRVAVRRLPHDDVRSDLVDTRTDPGTTAYRPLDLALIGFPKSGTTSLYEWLSAHPCIQGSDPKETRYFFDRGSPFNVWGEEPPGTFSEHGWPGLERFFHQPRQGRLRFEASPGNIYQDAALRALESTAPQPLILVALRCPADQIRSCYYFARNHGAAGNFIHPDLSFPAFVDALLEGDPAPLRRAVASAELRWYLGSLLRLNRYAAWLDRWSAAVSRERIMVIPFDGIRTAPRRTVTEICTRLGLDPSFYDQYEFRAHNRTLVSPTGAATTLASTTGGLLPRGWVRNRLLSLYHRLPSRQPLGPPRADEIPSMQALRRYFEPFNRDLAARYAVDVTTWYPAAAERDGRGAHGPPPGDDG
jgi:hypothetical protein